MERVSASTQCSVLGPTVAQAIVEGVPVDLCGSSEQNILTFCGLALAAPFCVHSGVIEIGPNEHVLLPSQGEGISFPRPIIVEFLIVVGLPSISEIVDLEVLEG